jgi:hypothetical protein
MGTVFDDTVNIASNTMTRLDAIWTASADTVVAQEQRKREAITATHFAVQNQPVGGAPTTTPGAAPTAQIPADTAATPLGPTDDEILTWLEKEASAQEQVNALRDGFRQQDIDSAAKAEQIKLQQQEQFLGDAMSLMNAKSKTLFNIGKAAAIANAVIKAKESVVSAYAFGSSIGGPVLGAVFGGVAAAAQAANIASIASQSYGGKGGGVSSAGGSVPVPRSSETVGTGLIAQPGQARAPSIDIRLTGIRPDDMITGSYLQKIIEGIGETLSDNGGKMGRVELVTA